MAAYSNMYGVLRHTGMGRICGAVERWSRNANKISQESGLFSQHDIWEESYLRNKKKICGGTVSFYCSTKKNLTLSIFLIQN